MNQSTEDYINKIESALGDLLLETAKTVERLAVGVCDCVIDQVEFKDLKEGD